MKWSRAAILLAGALLAVDLAADTAYETPIGGNYFSDFNISDFVDRGDGSAPLDYFGGFHAYLGHTGIDIALRNFKLMETGIPILAAAPGVVTWVMDGFFDRNIGEQVTTPPGNYIFVRHADDSEAMYYHFRRNSIIVTNGQTVVTGQKLGEIGSSGNSVYPHVHFEVRVGGTAVDIMTGQGGQTQSFDWFDSYSNQVVRRVVEMGTTTTNDPLGHDQFFQETPRSYSSLHNGIHKLTWIKYLGMAVGDQLRIRCVPVAGAGTTVDLAPWPWQYGDNIKYGWCWWGWWWDAPDGTVYKMQYKWNDESWCDAPNSGTFTIDDSQPFSYVSNRSSARHRYVNAANPGPVAPYTSWQTAAQKIQDAIDVSRDGDTIMVTNGVYATGSTAIPDGSLARVALNRSVFVRSVNGPLRTVIRGGTAGGLPVRCAYLASGANLAGFTLTGGTTTQDAGTGRGGGAYCEGSSTLCNCVVSNNSAYAGGGVYGGAVYGSLIARNQATTRGGGLYHTDRWQNMCTIVDNSAGLSGGGIYGGSLYESIVYYNTAGGLENNIDSTPGLWAVRICATPLPPGDNNFDDAPRFADRSAGNYRLAPDSPCRDRVQEPPAVGWSLDLDFRQRIVGSLMDVGAYEYNPVLPAPTGVTAADARSAAAVRVIWDYVPYADGYAVARSPTTNRLDGIRLANVTGTTWRDVTARPRVQYWYWVKATNGVSNGEWSVCDPGSKLALPAGYGNYRVSDLTVYSDADGRWYIRRAADVANPVVSWGIAWGWSGAVNVPGDYDGDHLSDLAVYDQSTGRWYIRRATDPTTYASRKPAAWTQSVPLLKSPYVAAMQGGGMCNGRFVKEVCLGSDAASETTASPAAAVSSPIIAWNVAWGGPGMSVAPGDYDGDGRSDLALFENATGAWYIRSLDGRVLAFGLRWGYNGATPVPGDFNGDGVYDLAVYDEARGRWFIGALRNGAVTPILWNYAWGGLGLRPVPGNYDGDSTADMALFERSGNAWFIRSVAGRSIAAGIRWGWPGATPVPGDYDGDGVDDLCVVNTANGAWYAMTVGGRVILNGVRWGWSGAVPVSGAAW